EAAPDKSILVARRNDDGDEFLLEHIGLGSGFRWLVPTLRRPQCVPLRESVTRDISPLITLISWGGSSKPCPGPENFTAAAAIPKTGATSTSIADAATRSNRRLARHAAARTSDLRGRT